MLVNQPGGYAEMGIYSAANQWGNAIAFIPSVLAQVALPLLSSVNGERDSSHYSQALRWNLILTAAAATAVAGPVALAAPYIMRLYGSTFQQGSLVLVLLSATSVISCLNGVIGTAIFSAGSAWARFAFSAMWAAVFIAGCHFLVPKSLAVGLAGSMLGAYIAHSAWQALYLRHRLSYLHPLTKATDISRGPGLPAIRSDTTHVLKH
jgi:O-antigen/teichoic acid export membrane protein